MKLFIAYLLLGAVTVQANEMDTLWFERYDVSGNSRDFGVKVLAPSQDVIYVLGNGPGVGASDGIIARYDGSGLQRWVKSYSVTGTSHELAYDGAVDANGNIYMVGRSFQSPVLSGYIVSYDSLSNFRWAVVQDSAQFSAVDIGPDGKVLVTGYVVRPDSWVDLLTREFDTSGVVGWQHTFGAPEANDASYDVEVDNVGNVYVVGESQSLGDGDYQFLVIKYNASGSEQWVRFHDGTEEFAQDYAAAVALDGVGNVYAVGVNTNAGKFKDVFTVKYLTDGSLAWSDTYDGFGRQDEGYDIAVGSDGTCFITGYSHNALTQSEILTMAFDPAGSKLWTRRGSGIIGESGLGTELEVDQQLSAYVVGRRFVTGQGANYACMKYSIDGTLRWNWGYNGPSNGTDLGESIALGSLGEVYVTGTSNGGTSREDMVTCQLVARDSIVMVDPHPNLTTSADLDHPETWAASSTLVKGVIADSATNIILRLPVDDVDSVVFEISSRDGFPGDEGALDSLSGTGAVDTKRIAVGSLTTDVGIFAFAVYRSPRDFVRSGPPGTDDIAAVERVVDVFGLIYPTGGGDPTEVVDSILIRRPPAVLIHGVWSSADKFSKEYVSTIEDGAKRIVVKASYASTSSSSFSTNRNVCWGYVNDALSGMRKLGFAATRADVVGHSMGGILARRHIQFGTDWFPNERTENFYAGDINRLVLIDSPQFGSPLADILTQMNSQCEVEPSLSCELLTAIGAKLDDADAFTGGAVYDLRAESPRTAELSTIGVPAHAFFGNEVLTAGENFYDINAALWLTGFGVEPVPFLYNRIIGIGGVTREGLFCNAGDDYIVGVSSQKARLTGDALTALGDVSHSEAIDDSHAEAVKALLDTRRASSSWGQLFGTATTDICHPPSASLTMPIAKVNRLDSFGPSGVEPIVNIVDPTPGMVVQPGQTVAVQSDVTGAPANALILYVADGVIESASGPTYSMQWQIPQNALGVVSITAYLLDATDVIAVSPELTLLVELNSTLLSIEASPTSVNLPGPGASFPLSIAGNYSDSIERELTPPSSSPSFQSSDLAVATVDSTGRITAIAQGQCEVVTSLEGVEDTTQVTVDSNEPIFPSCNCLCHTDPVCDNVKDVLDVAQTINVAFRNGTSILDPDLSCPHQTTDVNCDGFTDILDVTRMVNVAFRNGNPITEFCAPCP